MRGIEEFLDTPARFLIAVGRRSRKEMHAAMDIGVFALGELGHRLKH
jgi:hypothetical protein